MSAKQHNKKHEIDGLILACMDFRLHPHLYLYFKKQKNQFFDFVVCAGGAKNLVRPEKKSEKAFLIEQIKKSVFLHGTQELLLVNHLDCGAYGGSAAFLSKEKEISFHTQELQRAKKEVKKHFPRLKVRMFLAEIFEKEEGDYRVTLQELK